MLDTVVAEEETFLSLPHRRLGHAGVPFSDSSSGASLVVQSVKNLPAMQETRVPFLGWDDPLEKKAATLSSMLAWETPWTEEPGGLQSMGSQESDTTQALNHHKRRVGSLLLWPLKTGK